MNSPHLPASPRQFHFKIRPFHITLAVVLAVHVAAFFLFFHKGDPGGTSSSSPTSGDLDAQKADVSWQHIDSLVQPIGNVVPASATYPPTVPPVSPLAPSPSPEVPAPPVLAETPAVPEPAADPGAGAAPPMPPERTIPIMAATPVAEGTGVAEPETPTAGTGTGFGDGPNAGFDFGAYDLLITKEFHQAWVQPLGVDTPFRRNVAKLSVTIGRNGKVDRFSLAGLTGVPELDSSVLAAARNVRRIAPLPDDYHGDTYDVTINFQLD